MKKILTALAVIATLSTAACQKTPDSTTNTTTVTSDNGADSMTTTEVTNED